MLQQSQTNDINQDTYNGWKNRETWLVNLWINNNPYLQAELMDIIKSDVGIYLKVQDKFLSRTLSVDTNSPSEL